MNILQLFLIGIVLAYVLLVMMLIAGALTRPVIFPHDPFMIAVDSTTDFQAGDEINIGLRRGEDITVKVIQVLDGWLMVKRK